MLQVNEMSAYLNQFKKKQTKKQQNTDSNKQQGPNIWSDNWSSR